MAKILAPPLTLTPSQQAALDHLLNAVARRVNTALHGPAGTGKTTLTGVLIERLLKQGRSVVVAAPTHKAVGVLRARVPADVNCCTVASLLGLKPMARGRYIQFVADFRQAEKRGQLKGVNVLVVDESSMLSEALGSELVKLAVTTKTTVICVGDAAQLPPVDPPPEHGEDESAHRGVMAQAFLNPPGGVARLTEVVRHQGPVLELATAIRQCTSAAEVNALWPSNDLGDANSYIVVHACPTGWLTTATAAITDPRWDDNPDTARIVAWSNRAVDVISLAVRKAQFKARASEGWQVGEIVGNGNAIQQPGRSMAPPMAPSTCEWRVVAAKPYNLKLSLADFKWYTPKTKAPREFSIGCDLTVQQLKLEAAAAGALSRRIEVYAPIPGDTSWADQINALRLNIVKIEAGPTRTKAWAKWHELRSYCCDLRSAAVLTVHRAQGSTFAGVWVFNDLAFCNTSDAVPLHYTALTRASRAVHVIRREK